MARTLFKPVRYELSQLLGDIDLGKLALPELQRPFIWKKVKVRDLLDSMYRGFPVGYLMIWNAAEVDSRVIGTDGKQHTPTEFIVDGQQRLTSLYAVMKGAEVTFADYSRGKIAIAFRPRDGRFEVVDAAIEKDPEFIPDITRLWTEEEHWKVTEHFLERLAQARPEAMVDGDETRLRDAVGRLSALDDYPFEAVQIGHEVDQESVAEIFLRVNSGGIPLTRADFILTMLSVFREEDRRRLEVFSQSAREVPPEGEPSPYNHLVTPGADQLLRVAVVVGFQRGRLQSVLSLLRGSDPDADQTLAEEERDANFAKLSGAIDELIDLTSWHEYLKAIMSAGFRRSSEITSDNNVLLVYALYLIGRRYDLSHSDLRTPIARYFFMSALTGRYTGSFETQITQDVQTFTEAKTGADYVDRLRQAVDTTLTSDYWSISLPEALATSAARSPVLYAYAASLCLLNARVPPFVEGDGGGQQKAAVSIRDLFDPIVQAKKKAVERHHLFPRKYLEEQGLRGARSINQIANLSYVEWPENIEISGAAPAEYWPRYEAQFTDADRFHHALPDGWSQMEYEDFLSARRPLMAKVVRHGFETIGAAPDDGRAGITDLVPDHLPDTYLQPDRPFSNDLAVRQLIRRLEGSVFWYEQHMDRKALEILSEELSLEGVTEVRLLSGPANLTSKTRKAFERFSEELEAQGLECQWRVLPSDRARQLHARVLCDDDETYELPPLNSVLVGAVDSIRASEIPLEPFEEAWNDDAATDLVEYEAVV